MPKPKPRRPQRKGKPKPTGPLELRNPHAVLQALERRPDDVVEVRIAGNQATKAWQRVLDLAEQQGRPVRGASVDDDNRRRSGDERRTMASALVKPKPEATLRDLLADADESQPGCWLVLEHVQDPHNVGAILRTAAFFGVRGCLLTKDQSASLTAIAYDISAGGVEAIPIATITNLSRTIDEAREAGLWVLGTSEHAETDLKSVATDRPWLVIVGNEESGLRRLTKEKCDQLIAIPCHGEVTSLNVSVATGIVLSHVCG